MNLADELDPDVMVELTRRAKVELRKRARALRAAIPASGIADRSARIVERLLAEPAIHAAQCVALFWPITGKNEVDLRALDAVLREGGKSVAYPRIEASPESSPESSGELSFRIVASPDELVPGGMGTREPPPEAPLASAIDVVVVPCLLVAASGHRLGYGKGHYDRALPRLCPPAIAIAVAFDFQLAPEVPIEPGDVPVDRMVTDTKVLVAKRGDL